MALDVRQFRTAPFQAEAMLQEYKKKRYGDTWTVQQRGGVLIYGNSNYPAIFGGLKEYGLKTYGAHYVRVLRDRELHLKCLEAAEAHGYARETCSSMRMQLGQLFLDMVTQDPQGNPVKPDFIVEFNMCQVRPKAGQVFAEKLGVPSYLIDIPDHIDTPHARRYLANQFLEVIEFMEKHSGLKYDDEKFVEAVRNHWLSSHLWSEIINLMKNVPTPIDMLQLQHFRRPLVTGRERREGVEFYTLLRDEVKERLEQGIAARPFETARLTFEGMLPLYDSQMTYYPLKYGAVVIGQGGQTQQGVWDILDDGTYVLGKLPWERGMRLENREDAAMAMADFYCGYKPPHQGFFYREGLGRVWFRDVESVKRVRDWRADGVIVVIDRGCHQYELSKLEVLQALRREGIPAMTFECNQNDPRDYDIPEAIGRMEVFMESLGLSALPIEVESGVGQITL